MDDGDDLTFHANFNAYLALRYGDPFCFEQGDKMTALGRVTKLTIGREDNKPMSWREIWEVFARHYPGKYAIEVFPPAATLVDRVQFYHLWLIHDPVLMAPFDLKGGIAR